MPVRVLNTGLPTVRFNDPVSPVSEGFANAAQTLMLLGPQLAQIQAAKEEREARRSDSERDYLLRRQDMEAGREERKADREQRAKEAEARLGEEKFRNTLLQQKQAREAMPQPKPEDAFLDAPAPEGVGPRLLRSIPWVGDTLLGPQKTNRQRALDADLDAKAAEAERDRAAANRQPGQSGQTDPDKSLRDAYRIAVTRITSLENTVANAMNADVRTAAAKELADQQKRLKAIEDLMDARLRGEAVPTGVPAPGVPAPGTPAPAATTSGAVGGATWRVK